MELVWVSVTARSEPTKMRHDKLKSGVNWQGALKHNGRKTYGRKMKIGYNSMEQSPSEAARRQLVRKFHTFWALTRFNTFVIRPLQPIIFNIVVLRIAGISYGRSMACVVS
jgi:hypothetical protein